MAHRVMIEQCSDNKRLAISVAEFELQVLLQLS